MSKKELVARRILLAMMDRNLVEMLEHHPDSGIPSFTKKEIAQSRRDKKQIAKSYDANGRFLRGKLNSEMEFLMSALEAIDEK